MASLDELIAGARTAARPHRDVDITLDRAVAARIEAIDDRYAALEQEQADVTARAEEELADAARDARLSNPQTAKIETARDKRLAEVAAKLAALDTERDALTDGTLITLRFTQLPGQVWAEIGARNPARVDVTIDRVYGYNYHEVAKAAATYREKDGRGYTDRVLPADGDTEPVVEPVTADQLTGILEVITGHEFERIASAIWDLNDYGPQQRIAAAGKASRAGSANRSN